MPQTELHICLISVHGLIRGNAPELGRDADTGGQVLYVIELARALAQQKHVKKVDLVTRRIQDQSVSADYARPLESLCENAQIIRIAAGGDLYKRKEELWECLDIFVDNLTDYYRATGLPSLVHSHYADAGYVGSRLSHVLGLPMIHTGHSLGRVKRRRLLATGMSSDEVDTRYNMRRRIIAEEQTLASAARVIASTYQEIEEQYGLYNFYKPEAMSVIPPGTDVSRFRPPRKSEPESQIAYSLERFLRSPEKPMILALSRADPRKNISTLLHAYGSSEELQRQANLVIVIGNRGEIDDLEPAAQDVLIELLRLIDKYDLYGKVAYPKQHQSDDVPVLYRMAVRSGGVLVNPALTEPFGLTLIEAAASGLPVVATADGGPNDIVANCRNGLLVDPLEPADIAGSIHTLVTDRKRWQSCAMAGLVGVREHYVWPAHAQRYVKLVRQVLRENNQLSAVVEDHYFDTNYIDRALFTDLNRSLLGNPLALDHFIECIRANRSRMKFGICTGYGRDAALRLLRRYHIPEPDVLITSAGTEISYAPKLTPDVAWVQHIEKQWTPKQVRRILLDVPGVSMRAEEHQSAFKISYHYDPALALPIDQITDILHQEDQSVRVIYSHGKYLNIIPLRASKGLAMRYAVTRFNIPLERTLAIGGSGADEDMMRGKALAAIIGNLDHNELSQVEQSDTVYFAQKNYAAGILEAMDHYDFLGSCKSPEPNSEVVS